MFGGRDRFGVGIVVPMLVLFWQEFWYKKKGSEHLKHLVVTGAVPLVTLPTVFTTHSKQLASHRTQ